VLKSARIAAWDGLVPASPLSRRAEIVLARQAAAGDVRATRRFLETIAPAVVRAVYAMLVQLTLLAVVQALPAFRGECDPRHFAIRIAFRTAAATRRRYRSRFDRLEEVDVDNLEAPFDDPYARLRRQAVLDLVDALSEEQAETMVLRFAMGWKLREIATATNTPFNTVRSRLRLAKDALLRRIQENPALAEALDAPGED
jgi:RNA polymerase sigma-70 factor (ECF subfamily)